MVIDNTLSDALTVIEINGLDRPGLLYDVTREISDMNLDIASAHIATFGEKDAVFIFHREDSRAFGEVAFEFSDDGRKAQAALDDLERAFRRLGGR